MKILNWNTQADRLRVGAPKFEKIRELIVGYDADVVCLTEALSEDVLTQHQFCKQTILLSDCVLQTF